MLHGYNLIDRCMNHSQKKFAQNQFCIQIKSLLFCGTTESISDLHVCVCVYACVTNCQELGQKNNQDKSPFVGPSSSIVTSLL